jgi:hypothetical protein
MPTKTRYQRLIEERLGVPLEQFLLHYRRQVADGQTTRYEVAKRNDIPEKTLRNWEEAYLVIRETVNLRAHP